MSAALPGGRRASSAGPSDQGDAVLNERSWLASLDALRLECDGMTRVISALLHRDGIAHSAMLGRLGVCGVGEIPNHYWIQLADGRLIDLRARMWLGDDPRVPHGVFEQERADARYEGLAVDLPCAPVVFWALTDLTIDAFPSATFLASPKVAQVPREPVPS